MEASFTNGNPVQSLLFAGLAQRRGISRALPFSQRAWRRRHFAADPGPLCTGLVNFWLRALLQRRKPLGVLRTPSRSTLEQIVALQSSGVYPEFPSNHVPTKADRAMLLRKYGSSDWLAVSREIQDTAGGDCILYDLLQQFDYESVRIHTHETPPTGFSKFPDADRGTAFVAVIRYCRSGREGGHRVAAYVSRTGRCHFFDPNAGAVVEPNGPRFQRWLRDYYQDMPHRSFELPASGPALSLYELRGVRCATGRAKIRSQLEVNRTRSDA